MTNDDEREFEVHHVIGLQASSFRGWRKGLTQRPCGQCSTMVVLNEASRDLLRHHRPKPQVLCHVCAWEKAPKNEDGSREFYHGIRLGG